MQNFIKVFLVLVFIVGAFSIGRNYGEGLSQNNGDKEKLKHQAEYILQLEKQISELKSQTTAGNNQSAVIQSSAPEINLEKQNEKPEVVNNKLQEPDLTTTLKQPKPKSITKLPVDEFKNYEWLLEQKAKTDQSAKQAEAIKVLSKLRIQNFASVKDGEQVAPEKNLENKVFRGSFIDNSLETFGSAIVSFKDQKLKLELLQDGKKQISFEVDNINEHLKRSQDFAFSYVKADQKYLQLYPLNNGKQLAGRLYEVLPNETTKSIGIFILNSTSEIK